MQLQAPAGWFRLIGPIFWCDLVRTARRRSYLFVRWSYPAAVFILMLLVFAIWSMPNDHSPTSSADFCEAFFGVYMSFNLLAVLLLSPAYTAGALAEEKEHQTLDALLASDLRDREIVLGTYLARVAKLGMIFLAPLPLFSCLQFLGGLEPLLIVAGFGFTLLSMCSLAALSMLFSVRSTKPRDALVKTYMAAFVFLAGLTLIWAAVENVPSWQNYPSTDAWRSPITAEDVVHWANIGNPVVVCLELVRDIWKGWTLDKLLPAAFGSYAAFHAAVILLSCGYAIVYMRRYALGMNLEKDKAIRQEYSAKAWLRSNWCYLPVLANRPMIWKELLVDRTLRRGAVRRLIFGLGISALLLPLIHLSYFFHGELFRINYPRSGELMSLWLRFLCAALGCIALLQTLATAAASISGERDKQTLAELLATPLTNRAIFYAKWQAAVFRAGSVWAGLGALWCAGLAMGILHPLAILSFLVCWLSFAAFLASLGIWFSVIFRTTRQATAVAFLSCSAILGGALVASYNLAEKHIPTAEAVGLFPPAMLAYVTFTPGEWSHWLDREVAFRPVIQLIDLSVWWLGSFILFLAARSRFSVTTGRVQGDSETATTPELSQTASWTTDTLPPPAWGRTLTRISSSYGRRIVLFTVSALPLLVLIAVYQVRALRGAEDFRGILAQLDASEPGWQNSFSLLPESGAVVEAEPHGICAILLSAERLLPKDFINPKLDEAFNKDWPDQILLNAAAWQVIQKSQETARSSLTEIRRLERMDANVARGPWRISGWQTQDIAQKIGRLIALEATIHLQEGHPENALASIGSLLNVAAALGDPSGTMEPYQWLQRAWVLESALNLSQRALAQGEASEEALAKFQQQLEQQDELRIENFLRMERAHMYLVLTQQQEGALPGEWVFLEPHRSQNGKPNGVPALPSIDELVFLTNAKSLEVQRAEVLALLRDSINGSFTGLQAPPARMRFTRFLTSLTDICLLDFYRPASQVAYVRCMSRTTIVALALERFRHDHGDWPARLDELTPTYLKSIPLGLWDGKPLIYKRLKDGAVVYTLGADLIDRGGTLARHSWNIDRHDIGVRLWNVPNRRQQPVPPSPGEEP
jgi:ABC-type transport system involved in multi-copper enzyme maturation permease subunit